MSIFRFRSAFFASLPPTLASSRALQLTGGILVCALLSACGGGSGKIGAPEGVSLSGRTSFASPTASPLIGNARNYGSIYRPGGALESAMDVATGSNVTSDTRTITEGDIYRVLDAGKTLLNLNPYRGLQIIDLSNPVAPKILGRVAITGTPTEMYRIGDRVYVLMNSWSQYRVVQKDGAEVLDRFHGAAVITVDISNRNQPKILNSTTVDGYIGASRMSSGGGKSALYFTVQQYKAGVIDSSVKSLAIDAQGNVQAKSSIGLGNYVQAIQAMNDRLMVASFDAASASANNWRSRISVIDISSPDGVMIKGADVAVSGVVKQKNNMHIQGNIMRIVSSSVTGGIVILDSSGMLRTSDPVVFTNLDNTTITPTTVTVNGTATGTTTTAPLVLTTIQTSSLNTNHVETFNIADIAKPVAVDHDTFGAEQQLYGTTFLPDRAFFVTYLRRDPFHAFSITPDGVMQEENEFIVSGWNDFFVPVQANSRMIGVGHNDANNRRALAISLYDITNLKNTQPLVARAEVDLAYSFSEANWDDRAFTVLDNATNVLADDGKTLETGLVLLPYTGWDSGNYVYKTGVQIFSFSATTLTRRGSMQQDSQVRRSFMGDSSQNIAANLSVNELSLFGIANPNAPVKKSSLELSTNYSQFVALSNVGVRYRASDFGWWGSNSAAKRTDAVEVVALNNVDGDTPIASVVVPASSKIFNVGNHLSVVTSEMVGNLMRTTIKTYDLSIPTAPRLTSNFVSDEILGANNFSNPLADICMSCGGYASTQVLTVGKALVFVSRTLQNDLSADGKTITRYWSNQNFQVLNLEDVNHPVLLPKISMAKDEENVDVIQNGSSLWVNYQKAQQQLGPNGELQSKYFVKELNLTAPANPRLGKEINIPGQLMAIVGDQFYCLEYSTVGRNIEPSLHMLIVQNNLAYLQATVNLSGKYPTGLLADSNAVVLTSMDSSNYQNRMDIYAVPVKDFALQSTTPLESGANSAILRPGRLMVLDWYGLFLYDISQIKTPKIRAYFPVISWNGNLSVVNKDIYLPASYFGVYQFNLDTINITASQ
ncbi:beta-propeller domain-containing protein [Undibacterium flavidum]|uniref:Beta-propeller domain-containing protein n=1 Tax=Undibacterium flavidum TaxID=2762297 RepID=A0ABR6YB45_9BURK|nr:beta-propeller domain-containing protein [Undibacterium flavidum]MBC3873797.1 beta-propeller domain-containing protein [Undibacterium flavidum]